MLGDLRRYAAANARVRALLSTLLGRAGLETLCGYPTGAAVRAALLRTPYGGTPEGVNTSDRFLLARLAAVGRVVLELLDDPERTFLRHYLLHHEVDTLKLLIRGVAGHVPAQVLAAHLTVWEGIGTIAPSQFADAADPRALVEHLADTAYGPALHAALHRLETAGTFALEVSLELDYYERLWTAATTLHPTDRERAQHLLGILVDILNLGWISRYHTLGLSLEEILNYTLRQGRWVTLDIRRFLAEQPDTQWSAALASTPYAALLAETGTSLRRFDAAAVVLWRFLAGEIQRALMGYPFHIGVPLGFLLAQEIEIRDLRVVLAAKSIGVPNAEIVEHLASVRH